MNEKLDTLAGGQLTLGKFLRAIRLEKGKSLPAARLRQIEAGLLDVSPELASKFADALGYSRSQMRRLAAQEK